MVQKVLISFKSPASSLVIISFLANAKPQMKNRLNMDKLQEEQWGTRNLYKTKISKSKKNLKKNLVYLFSTTISSLVPRSLQVYLRSVSPNRRQPTIIQRQQNRESRRMLRIRNKVL